MTWGDRVRAWLAGRNEFRALVEVDPARAAPLGGRPVPGTTCAEFTQVAHGSRAFARQQAAKHVQAMLDSELPGARLLAVRDGGPPRCPMPAMRLAGGARPRLLLVGADTSGDAERLAERVCRVWGLPSGRYTDRWVPDRSERPPTWQVVLAVACMAVLCLLVAAGGGGEQLLSRMFHSGAPAGQLAVAVAAALAALRWFQVRRRGWARWRGAFAATQLLVPALAVVVLAAAADLMSAAVDRFPVASGVVFVGLCVAAAPVGVSRLEWPRLWAVLAWGLPLLAGGIAPFAGGMVLDHYLARFQLGHLDVQVAIWGQWAIGVVATGLVLVGVYVGVAVWILGRRVLGPSAVVVFAAALVGVSYAVIAATVVTEGIDRGAQLRADGVPRSPPGLHPVAVCVDPVEQPYSYIGRAAPRPGAAAVYFGRADGRLAVWTAETGGVLLDAQQVSLRVVDDVTACR